jgi:hypothetical protein
LAGEMGTRLQSRLGRLTDPELLVAVAGPAIAAFLTLVFVVPTLAPTVASWDTAEFQTVAPVLGTAHPTGYPSYIILGWLASIVLLPFGDPAYRMNLLQAILAAVAVAGTAGVVQILTGRRLIALATGVMLACSQLFWRLSTHADPHMFHVALVAILFMTLLTWDQRLHSRDEESVRHADRWLVASAFVYGVAVANHSLALLLPPAIGLFVLAADWRVIMRWRTIVDCMGVLAVTIVVLFLELPIRAAINAPLIYGHPDTWSGFQYVVLAEQFRGSLSDPFGDLPAKANQVVNLITGWLGPLAPLAAVGLATSVLRRPRYIILSGLAAAATCVLAASYANADIQRYYLLPLLVAITWIGLGAADIVAAVAWVATEVSRTAGESTEPFDGPTEPAQSDLPVAATSESAALEPYATESSRPTGLGPRDWTRLALLAGELVVAAVIVFSAVGVVPSRQLAAGSAAGAVSEAGNTGDSKWMYTVLAPADRGGLPADSVIVGWWSVSTTLWYGQKVLGLRPDIYIVDDRTRLDDNLGEVQDVFNRFLDKRPVFTIRLDGGVDGMVALGTEFNIQPFDLGNGVTISQVVGRKGSQ